MEAFNEERPLTPFEKSKIESIEAEFERDMEKFRGEMDSKSDKEINKESLKYELATPVHLMYMSYDYATSAEGEEDQKNFLDSFLEHQQTAETILGLENK